MDRRDILKGLAGAASAASLGLSATGRVWATPADKVQVPVKIAGYAYDRVRALQDGRIGMGGYDVSFHVADIYAVSRSAFGPARTYEVSEIGLIPYVTRYANNKFRAYTLIPVFSSRIFRHRNIFVRTDSGIEKPEDLRGKRVATPGYGMSATTWIRGFLQDVHGVRPEHMHWVEILASSDGGDLQKGTNSKYLLPDDFPLEYGPPGVDESEMIIAGDVDALITAITPQAFIDGHPQIKRLFPDFRSAEQEYYSTTGVFPIMHAVGIRRDFADANPDLPAKVFRAYSQAKKLAYDDLESTTSLKVTLPWVTQEFEDTRSLMGDNFWSYGLAQNQKELELVMRYTYEHGLAKRRLDIEEIFHPSTLDLLDRIE